MTTLNDIVLIYLEDTPVSFARIESILPDHKKDWYQVKLLMLQIPLQVVTWILRDVYIEGEEFHMNQKKMRLEKVVCPADVIDGIPPSDSEKLLKETAPENRKEEGLDNPDKKEDSQIISFSDFKKKDHGPDKN